MDYLHEDRIWCNRTLQGSLSMIPAASATTMSRATASFGGSLGPAPASKTAQASRPAANCMSAVRLCIHDALPLRPTTQVMHTGICCRAIVELLWLVLWSCWGSGGHLQSVPGDHVSCPAIRHQHAGHRRLKYILKFKRAWTCETCDGSTK